MWPVLNQFSVSPPCSRLHRLSLILLTIHLFCLAPQPHPSQWLAQSVPGPGMHFPILPCPWLTLSIPKLNSVVTSGGSLPSPLPPHLLQSNHRISHRSLYVYFLTLVTSSNHMPVIITIHLSHWTAGSQRAAPESSFTLIINAFCVCVIVSGHSRNTCWMNESLFLHL